MVLWLSVHSIVSRSPMEGTKATRSPKFEDKMPFEDGIDKMPFKDGMVSLHKHSNMFHRNDDYFEVIASLFSSGLIHRSLGGGKHSNDEDDGVDKGPNMNNNDSHRNSNASLLNSTSRQLITPRSTSCVVTSGAVRNGWTSWNYIVVCQRIL